AGIDVSTVSCGCSGIQTSFGDVKLKTTGAGDITIDQPIGAGANAFITSAGNVTVNEPVVAFSGNIGIALAPGFTFTNASPGDFSFAGLDASQNDGTITILADQMSLSAGTINAGFGAVILGPATLNRDIVLGAAGTATTLGLQQADLDTIVTGSLQIGYR